MRRDSDFNKTKLTSITNGKTVIDAYVDSFPIEKVKITVSEFGGNKNRINMYIDFADFLRIAEQVKNGTIFQKIQAQGKPEDLYRGGYTADGQIWATSLQINYDRSGKIFFNASAGPGTRTQTGAIMPSGNATIKINVPASYEDCLAMFMYIDLAIRHYLPNIFDQLIANIDQKKNFNVNVNANNNNVVNSGVYPDPASQYTQYSDYDYGQYQ